MLRWLSGSTLGALVACVLVGCGADEHHEDAEPTIPAEDLIPHHVYVKPPASSVARLFPEGGGLIRRMSPEHMDGETGWWYAYLTPYELRLLADEGVAWRSVGASSRGAIEPLAAGGNPATECTDSAGLDEFCGYVSGLLRCNRPMLIEMADAPIDYPPVGGEDYVEVVELGLSATGTPIVGVRIGELWDEGDGYIPQLVLFSAQHSREWVASEFAMRLVRYYAGSYRDGTNGVRSLLADVAILIIPVANPDGYEFTLQPGGRLWRPTREPCAGGIGTDPNRNHAFSRGEPGAWTSCSTNETSQYRGDAAESAPETKALEIAIANDGPGGQYMTHFSLNVHSYGNLLLFPEGFSSSFSPCTTDSNCTAPDLGAFYDLVGTELSPLMTDEETNRPYIATSSFRNLYAVSGDTTTEHVYGTLGFGYAPNHMGAAIELTNSECTFYAEQIPDAEMDVLFGRFEDFVTKLLGNVPSLVSGSFFEHYQLPHLHRRSADGANGLAEYPTLRVARRGIGPVDFLAGGISEQDDVLPGAFYEMWRFRPSDSYKFPLFIPVCAEGFNCREIMLSDPGTGILDLCDPNLFATGDGWSFDGNAPGGPQDECVWRFDGASGTSPWQLTSSHWSIDQMKEAKLVYSFRWQDDEIVGRVLVSTNGFTGCSETGYGSCRIVRRYPYGHSNHDGRDDGRYRTEIIDISDFDGSPDIQVRFEVTSASMYHARPWLDIYDPVIVGWKE